MFGITPRKSIHEREYVVEEKSRFGDIEIDTIIGKNHKQAILTLVDRKSKYTWMQKLIFKRSDILSVAVNKKLNSLKNHIHTITADNGSEFASYEKIGVVTSYNNIRDIIVLYFKEFVVDISVVT